MLKPLAKGAAASLDQRRLVKNNARKLQRDRAMNRHGHPSYWSTNGFIGTHQLKHAQTFSSTIHCVLCHKMNCEIPILRRGRAGIDSVPDAAAARAPKRIATSSGAARAGNERMERLKKFQEERARKRAEARTKETKAPFYVGVYKVGLGFL